MEPVQEIGALMVEGRNAEAEVRLQALRAERPGDGELALLHGQVLQALGRPEQAVTSYLQAIALAPLEVEPLRNLGAALEQVGEIDQALSLYEQALQLAPEDIGSLYSLGRCLSLNRSVDAARPSLEAILRIDPDNVNALYLMGANSQRIGAFETALAEFRQVLSLAAGDRILSLTTLHQLVFLLSQSLPRHAADYAEATASFWDLLRQEQPPVAVPAVARSTGSRAGGGERLRVGILSSDLGTHTVSSFLGPFLASYPRDQLHLELIATKLRFEDSAETMARQVEAAHSVQGLNLADSRSLLRQRQYDVLVDTAGFTHPRGIVLMAERCAPVQCHWIGYHASTGLDTIDWFLGDDVFTPETFTDQFRERLWRLPRPWLARSRSVAPPEAVSTAGDARPVLGSFNQLAKVREETLDFWAAALHAVPEAQLLIKDQHTGSETARERILQRLRDQGIDPARLTFLQRLPNRNDHLRAYNAVDIALDATPWSSSSTAFDALSMGVPLVAIRGGSAAARMSNSVVAAIGRPGWIADDPAGFAAVVAELAGDLAALRHGKADLQREVLASPLHDPADLARHVSEAFQAMHRLAA